MAQILRIYQSNTLHEIKEAHMTAGKKTVVLIFFVAFFLIWFGAGPAGNWALPETSAAGPAEIYAANCAACHGRDGRATTARGKRAGATDFTSDWNHDEARGIRIITNGKGEMPSFKHKLSAAEIKSVFGYVSRFK